MGQAMVDERLIALAPDRAARLAGVSRRQVDYWARRGVVTPTVDRRVGQRRRVRLYGHIDLLSLLVAAQLRNSLSLQAIRKIITHLRDRGYESPLSELVFAVDGKDVYIQHPGGEWVGHKQPDQIVMHQVLHLEPLRARIRSAVERDRGTIGHVERRRGALGSKPLIAGTRVPVDTVVRYLERGATTEDVLRSFPVLQPEDVEAVRRKAV